MLSICRWQKRQPELHAANKIGGKERICKRATGQILSHWSAEEKRQREVAVPGEDTEGPDRIMRKS